MPQTTTNKHQMVPTLPKKTGLCALTILLLVIYSGCMRWQSTESYQTPTQHTIPDQKIRADTFVIYFYREANYSGAGRVHLLKIDGKEIGPIGAENYYRLELWPGEYHLSVYLPAEDFLGRITPATHISMQLDISPVRVPGTDMYIYRDGYGIDRVTSVDAFTISRLLSKRKRSASLCARDTAQVKFLHGARYDGPSFQGKAHGVGTLTWEDGNVFNGRFEYGSLTTEGKFSIPNGKIYMGPNSKGRPIGPGIWMTPSGQITYAGEFLNEVPHGTGVRSGVKGPQFCEYYHGEDITKTLRQIVIETIKEEDQREAEQIAKKLAWKDVVIIEGIPSAEDQDRLITDMDLDWPDFTKSKNMATPDPAEAMGPLVVEEQIPYLRILAKQKEVERDIQDRIETMQTWCQEEFLIGRRLCVCAPFAKNFDRWDSCEKR